LIAAGRLGALALALGGGFAAAICFDFTLVISLARPFLGEK
jgi:hypothetical protein